MDFEGSSRVVEALIVKVVVVVGMYIVVVKVEVE